MTTGRSIARGASVRRIVQLSALALFFGLVLTTRRPYGEPSRWLQAFFLIDPLVGLLTWLGAHTVPTLLGFSLLTLGLTMLLGRVFCGWFCPLGTIHAIAGRVLDFCWPRRKTPEHWSRWQLAKYYLLLSLVVMAACGVHWGALLDPLVLLYRTTTVALVPGAQWAVESGGETLGLAEPARAFVREHVTEVERQAFLGSGLILVGFIVILALNRYRPRFWCRYVCPLGAMLGVFALRPFLRRTVEARTCNQCDLCGVDCHGAATTAPAVPAKAGSNPGGAWMAAECFGCFNCTLSCSRESVGFRFAWPWQTEAVPVAGKSVNRSRRGFMRGVSAALGAMLGSAGGMVLLRATPQSRGLMGDQGLIRPPGSLAERDFLNRCTACGMCMKICPTGCLQPAITEAGLEGLWTPRVVPRLGRCEYDCTLCGHVCPTGAISSLTLEEKHQVKIGIAVLDHSRCIPYAYGRDCGTCVEACPFPDKAIRLVDVEVSVHDGKKQRSIVVSQPMVDPDRCTGCGGCVKECTFKDEPAIRVVSANESRHPGVKPFLDLQQKRARKGDEVDPAASEASPYGT